MGFGSMLQISYTYETYFLPSAAAWVICSCYILQMKHTPSYILISLFVAHMHLICTAELQGREPQTS